MKPRLSIVPTSGHWDPPVLWTCRCHGRNGIGETPQSAYIAWMKSA